MSTHTYTIPPDFASGIDQEQLHQEILDDVTITKPLIGVDTLNNGVTVNIKFSIALTAPEITALGIIVANHVPSGIPKPLVSTGDADSNLGAIVDPTVNSDNTAGYSVGSTWINTATDTVFLATDVTTGAANWVEVNDAVKIQGVNVDATTPTTTGQLLIYNSGTSSWEILKPTVGDLVGTSDTQTLTNKTIDGSANTITNIDHGTSLIGLGDDDHTQYALLAGRSGGQTLTGGTAANNNLTLRSTTNATKGAIIIDETTSSTSKDSGALIVDGGVGVEESIYIGVDSNVGRDLKIGAITVGTSLITGKTTTNVNQTGSRTYTASEIFESIVLRSGQNPGITDVLPTAALLVAGISFTATIGDTFTTTFTNNGNNKITLTAGSGGTITPSICIVYPNESIILQCTLTNVTATTESYNVVTTANTLTNNRGIVHVATTIAGALATDYEAGDSIDGVTLVANDRILIKNQVSGVENGVYIVNATGSPTRDNDYASGMFAASTSVIVSEGSTNADTLWICTNDSSSDVINTDALVFSQISGESNTASNIGIGGVGIFDGKVGVDLQFKNINSGSNKITIVDDVANNEVDIDVVEANLTLDNIGGTLSVNKGGTGRTSLTANRFLVGDGTNPVNLDKVVPTGDVVGTTDTQTLSNKTITGLQINDTSADHQYVVTVNELTADRNVELPLLTTDDVFVFEDHTQTLSNKTLVTPIVNGNVTFDEATNDLILSVTDQTVGVSTAVIPDLASTTDTFVFESLAQTLANKTVTNLQINDTSADHQYVITVNELTADRNAELPLLTTDDVFVFESHAQTLTNKTIDGSANTITNIDHGTSLTGLGDDDHTQYALLAGRSGGQTLTGGTAANNNLTLRSTTNATKGAIIIDETTSSTSKDSGALIVEGGIGVEESIYIGVDCNVGGDFKIGAITAGTSLVTGKTTTTVNQTGSRTYTASEIFDSIILRNGQNPGTTDILPTAALLVAGIPFTAAIGDTFATTFTNNGSRKITIAAGSGGTITPSICILDTNESIFLQFTLTNVTATTESYIVVTTANTLTNNRGNVRVATTIAGTLTTDFEAGDTIDGVTLISGDRILIKNQAAGVENGIYIVNATGSPTRTNNYAGGLLAAGTNITVKEGTTNADTIWLCTNDSGSDVIGTDALTFLQISGESNTASNIGAGGVGVFDGKVGVDLQFKNINSGSNKITIVDDIANNEVDVDVVEANLTLDNIGGTLSVNKGGTGRTSLTANRFLVGDGINPVNLDKVVPTGDVVGTTDTQTLSNKTITGLQINDTSADHQYIVTVNELTADRNVELPLLTTDDVFVFEDHTQTLSNKTLVTPIINGNITFDEATNDLILSVTDQTVGVSTAIIPDLASTTDTFVFESLAQTLTNKTVTNLQINDTSADHQYVITVNELTADRNVELPLLTTDDVFVFESHTQTMSNKTFSNTTTFQTNILVDTISEFTGAAGVTIENVNITDDALTFTTASTGVNSIVIPDNIADALSIQEGSNKYMTFVTSNGSEIVNIFVDTSINGDTTITLDATERFLVDGSTNQRTNTVPVGTFRQTAANDGTTGLQLITDTNSTADTTSLDVQFVATGTAATDNNSVIAVGIDKSNSSGGNISGISFTEYGLGTVEVTALTAFNGVDVIRQLSGNYTSIDTAFVFTGVFTDVTAAFASTGTDTAIFSANGDIVYIGETSQFTAIEWLFDTVAVPSIIPTFEYSLGGGTWATFAPVDYSSGMQRDGVTSWRINDLTGWLTDTVNAVAGRYWIRITRTNASMSVTPIEDRVRSLIATEYSWNASGQLIVNSLSGAITANSLRIDDASATDEYIIVASELAADRNITLPALTTNDTFVFESHTQTLSNKTLVTPIVNGNITFDEATNDLILSVTDQTVGVSTAVIPDLASTTDTFVFESLTQTLSNKTVTNLQINDTSADHQYVITVNELTADRNVELPLLTTNDVFVFESHTQTLSNKTLVTPIINGNITFDEATNDLILSVTDQTVGNSTAVIPDLASTTDTFVFESLAQTLANKTMTDMNINDTSADHQYIITVNELTADRLAELPLLTTDDVFVFESHAQTLANKTMTDMQINDTSADHQYIITVNELTADRNVELPLLVSDDVFVFEDHSQILTNKTATDTSNNIAAKSLHSATTLVDVSGSAAPSAGQVLTAVNSTTATWQTPASGSASISYVLMTQIVNVNIITWQAVAFWTWDQARYGSYSSGTVIFEAVIGNRDLDIRLRDVTGNEVLGSSLAINASGFYTFSVTNPSSLSDGRFAIEVQKSANGGNNPLIYGITLEYTQ